MQQMVSARRAAKLLGVSPTTAIAMLDRGELVGYRTDTLVRITRSSIRRLMGPAFDEAWADRPDGTSGRPSDARAS